MVVKLQFSCCKFWGPPSRYNHNDKQESKVLGDLLLITLNFWTVCVDMWAGKHILLTIVYLFVECFPAIAANNATARDESHFFAASRAINQSRCILKSVCLKKTMGWNHFWSCILILISLYIVLFCPKIQNLVQLSLTEKYESHQGKTRNLLNT